LSGEGGGIGCKREGGWEEKVEGGGRGVEMRRERMGDARERGGEWGRGGGGHFKRGSGGWCAEGRRNEEWGSGEEGGGGEEMMRGGERQSGRRADDGRMRGEEMGGEG